MGRQVKVELHTHPLLHKYYFRNIEYKLTNDDKRAIARMIEWGMDKGVEIMCISDHDTTESSIWAQEYVRSKDWGIKIIRGAEVTSMHMADGDRFEVHIGAYGILRAPHPGLPTIEAVRQIKEQGGVCIMNHPMYYPPEFVRNYLPLFDGFEQYNHGAELQEIISRAKEMIALYGTDPEEAYNTATEKYHGAGYFRPDWISEFPGKLRVRSSDNHNSFELYDFWNYEPGTIDEDFFIGRKLIAS
jgi:hypothetical protein